MPFTCLGQLLVQSGPLPELPPGAPVGCSWRGFLHPAAAEELGDDAWVEMEAVHFSEEQSPSRNGGAAPSVSFGKCNPRWWDPADGETNVSKVMWLIPFQLLCTKSYLECKQIRCACASIINFLAVLCKNLLKSSSFLRHQTCQPLPLPNVIYGLLAGSLVLFRKADLVKNWICISMLSFHKRSSSVYSCRKGKEWSTQKCSSSFWEFDLLWCYESTLFFNSNLLKLEWNILIWAAEFVICMSYKPQKEVYQRWNQFLSKFNLLIKWWETNIHPFCLVFYFCWHLSDFLKDEMSSLGLRIAKMSLCWVKYHIYKLCPLCDLYFYLQLNNWFSNQMQVWQMMAI